MTSKHGDNFPTICGLLSKFFIQPDIHVSKNPFSQMKIETRPCSVVVRRNKTNLTIASVSLMYFLRKSVVRYVEVFLMNGGDFPNWKVIAVRLCPL